MTSTPLPDFYYGCEWPLDPGCLGDDWVTTYEPDVRARAQALAGLTLHRLTGQRVGGCPVVLRPCSPAACGLPGGYSTWISPGVNLSGQWVNNCGCTRPCGHTPGKALTLPGPVGRLDSVKVDGIELDLETDVWLWGNTLTRLEGLWPFTQDLDLPDTENGTFSITYLNAYPVDAMGAYAGGKLAKEFAKACVGKSCGLPKNVTSVSRQGVSFEMVIGAFPDGKTGIKDVDAWIEAWNPNGLVRPSTVWIPGR